MIVRPRPAAELVRLELPDGETVVRVNGGSSAVILNATGDAVLSLCNGRRTVDEITSTLRSLTTVPESIDLEADVAKLIVELLAAGLLHDA